MWNQQEKSRWRVLLTMQFLGFTRTYVSRMCEQGEIPRSTSTFCTGFSEELGNTGAENVVILQAIIVNNEMSAKRL